MTDTCAMFDSTPSRPHKKCVNPATGVIRNMMTREEKPACKKHLLQLDGFGAWRAFTGCYAARSGEGYWTCDVVGGCPDCRRIAHNAGDTDQLQDWVSE